MKLKHVLTEAKEVSPELKAFMDDFIAGTSQHPFARHLRIWNDSVGFEASIWNNAVDLGAIMSFIEKGKGDASKALKWFTDLADKHGVPIDLAVQPIKKAGAEGRDLNKRELTAWYKRNGFKSTGGEYMRREPKKLNESSDKMEEYHRVFRAFSRGLKKYGVTVRDHFSPEKRGSLVTPLIAIKLNKSQTLDSEIHDEIEQYIDDNMYLFPGFKYIAFKEGGLRIFNVYKSASN